MAYKVLARKYRPRIFDEVVGQEHVVRSLRNAVLNQKVGHAYLLTGTRGIGKTTVARIVAKALKCLDRRPDGNPCLECMSCLGIDDGSSMDFIEIDGASNNSVDNIRQLVDNVQYLPIQGDYKVYVIDEVHMLSNSAFNALLKTLEEPPKHVIFIFATTDPQKLLGTVLSRCQRFDFKNAAVDDLVAHVKSIAVQENAKFADDEIIRQLALQGKGSVRDTLSLFDQLLSYSGDGVINEDIMIMALGLPRSSSLTEILTAIFEGDVKNLSKIFRALLHENVELKNLAYSIVDRLYEIIHFMDDADELRRRELIDPAVLEDLSASELFWIFENLSRDMRDSLNSILPEKVCEIMLQKIALRRTFFQKEEKKNRVKPVVKNKSRSWVDFLDFVKGSNLALVANLEQGNLLGPLKIEPSLDGVYEIELAFLEKARVFYDFVTADDVRKKIVNRFAVFCDVSEEKVRLRITLLGFNDERASSFLSRADILKEEHDKLIQEKKDAIENHPAVKDAQRIFNTKVKKVVVNESN